MVNCYVALVVAFVDLAVIISGMFIGGFSGIIEMDGFRDAFSDLFPEVSNPSYGNQSSLPNVTGGCSVGNGADSDSLIGIIVSISNFGSILGSFVAGWLSDKFSRKYALSISGMTMALASIFLASSFFFWMLIVGRLVAGLAVGIFYMVTSVYIAEMTPKDSRGMLGSSIGPTYQFGTMIAYFTNAGYAQFYLGWRISIAVVAAISLVYGVGMWTFMPHTPRWLQKKGRDMEALLVLSKINHSSRREMCVDTHMELEELRAANSSSSQRQFRSVIKDLYQRKYRFIFACFLFIAEASSTTILLFYTTSILCEVGISPFISSMVTGFCVVLASIIPLFIIDRIGRKLTALIGIFTIAISGLMVALLVQLYETPSQAIQITIAVFFCIYYCAVGFSWLILPWIVASEVFPINIRGITVAVSTGVYWISVAILSQIIPLILGSAIQLHGLFYMCSGLNFFAFFLILFVLPETKGVSLERMDELFSQNIWKRFLGTFRSNTANQEEAQKNGEICLQQKLPQKVDSEEYKMNEAELETWDVKTRDMLH